MKCLKDPEVAKYLPVVATSMLESANVSQIWEMWSARSAAGQSILGWCLVNAALCCYLGFYIVCCPEQKLARWATTVGIGINALVILSVIYWRYLG